MIRGSVSEMANILVLFSSYSFIIMDSWDDNNNFIFVLNQVFLSEVIMFELIY
jgi:hypothetical protein